MSNKEVLSKKQAASLKSSSNKKNDSPNIEAYYGSSRSSVIPVQATGKSSVSSVSSTENSKIDKIQQNVGYSKSKDSVSSSNDKLSSGVNSSAANGTSSSVSQSNVENSEILSGSVAVGLETSLVGLSLNSVMSLSSDSSVAPMSSATIRTVNRTITNVSSKTSTSSVLTLPAAPVSSSSGYQTRAAKAALISESKALNFNKDFHLGATSPCKTVVSVSTPNPFEPLSDEDEEDASDDLVGSEPAHQKPSSHFTSVVSPLVSVPPTVNHGSGTSSVTVDSHSGGVVHRVEQEDEPAVYPRLSNPAEGTFPYTATQLPIPSEKEQDEEARVAHIESQLNSVRGSKVKYSTQAKVLSSSKSDRKTDRSNTATTTTNNNNNNSNPPTSTTANNNNNNNTSNPPTSTTTTNNNNNNTSNPPTSTTTTTNNNNTSNPPTSLLLIIIITILQILLRLLLLQIIIMLPILLRLLLIIIITILQILLRLLLQIIIMLPILLRLLLIIIIQILLLPISVRVIPLSVAGNQRLK